MPNNQQNFNLLVVLRELGPYIAAGLTAYIAYYFGKRKQIDEIKIKEAFLKAERISEFFHELHDIAGYLKHVWHEKGLGENIELGVKSIFPDSIDPYMSDQIARFLDIHNHLLSSINEAKIYLKYSDLKLLSNYVYEFNVLNTNPVLTEDFLIRLYKNLLDKKKDKIKEKLFNKISQNFSNIVK